nr:hypothetical protein GCM10020093_029590 [Planobispora longispora]
MSVAELLASYDRTTALNTVYLVPHGTVRHAAAADPGAMLRMVERGLAEGAAGLSSGLEYIPGRYGDAAELAALCAPVAAAGLPYVTHMRGYEEAAAAGLAEARLIAERSGVALHVSHYHGPGAELAGMIDDALTAGLDVTFDSYPYLSGFSILAMVALPVTWTTPISTASWNACTIRRCGAAWPARPTPPSGTAPCWRTSPAPGWPGPRAGASPRPRPRPGGSPPRSARTC